MLQGVEPDPKLKDNPRQRQLDPSQLELAGQIFINHGLEEPESVNICATRVTTPTEDFPKAFEDRSVHVSFADVDAHYLAMLDAGADQLTFERWLESRGPDRPAPDTPVRDFESYSDEEMAAGIKAVRGLLLTIDMGLNQVSPEEEAALLELLEQLTA